MRFVWYIARAMLGGGLGSVRGSDVYEALADNPQLRFDEQRLYWNFGLWNKQPSTMGDACEALTNEIASLGRIESAKRILDVGFGLGEQFEVWASRTNARIVGIDLCKTHVRSAAETRSSAGSGSRVELTVGDAVALPFLARQFDLILCVEAAFHFNRRADFFAEAARVLEPGGVLVMSDILPGERESWFATLWWSAFSKTMFVPRDNRVGLATYKNHLQEAGFSSQIVDVTPWVFTPFFEAAGRALGRPLARRGCALLARVFRRHSPSQYVLVRAELEDGIAAHASAGARCTSELAEDD